VTISTQDLHHAFAELSDLRFGEIDVDDAMARIVHATHAAFDVDGAGLMLADADQVLRNAAVSDERLDRLEALQVEHHEGPCIDAFEDKQLICAEDLATEARWPRFCPAAANAGVAAVLASPIPFNQAAIGVVTVVSEHSHPWAPEAELALIAFTDLAALTIASVMHGQRQGELSVQLQGALDSRAVIEQAKGLVAGRDKLTMREAYDQLRAQARTERRRLRDLCAELVADSAPPG